MTKGGKTKGNRRKPHNARSFAYGSFEELLRMIAAEPRTARVGDREVSMSREERLYRVMLDAALKGSVLDVTLLLKKMAENPTIAAAYREETYFVISGHLAHV